MNYKFLYRTASFIHYSRYTLAVLNMSACVFHACFCVYARARTGACVSVFFFSYFIAKFHEELSFKPEWEEFKDKAWTNQWPRYVHLVYSNSNLTSMTFSR